MARASRKSEGPTTPGDSVEDPPEASQAGHALRNQPGLAAASSGDSVLVHLGITITEADQLAALLRQGVVFRDCAFDGADFTDFYAEEMAFENCSLKRTDFSSLACQSLQITNSNLEKANFEKADIHEAELLDSICTSASFRAAKLNLSRMVDCDFSTCNFDGANLYGADLSGSRFMAVDLSQARLDATTIDRANFSMGSLRGHQFRRQKLVGVNFTETDLSGCDFTMTSFEGCHLNSVLVSDQTLLDGADLRGAYISSSQLAEASLKGTMMTAAQARSLLFERFGIIVEDDPESTPRA